MSAAALVHVELDVLANQALYSGAAGHVQQLIEALKTAGIASEEGSDCAHF